MSDADASSVQSRLGGIRLLAMDIDGVLTDGGIVIPGDAPEMKRFHVQDGLGLQLAAYAGIVVAWISGRESTTVERRARELGIHHLYQNTPNKSVALGELLGRYTLTSANLAYIGDDLNDLPAFAIAGVKFAPSNAVAEIKGLADFITEKPGGSGAVREVCDTILKAQGKWNDALTQYLARLLQHKE